MNYLSDGTSIKAKTEEIAQAFGIDNSKIKLLSNILSAIHEDGYCMGKKE